MHSIINQIDFHQGGETIIVKIDGSDVYDTDISYNVLKVKDI